MRNYVDTQALPCFTSPNMDDEKLTKTFGVRISETLQRLLRAMPRRKRQVIAEKVRVVLEDAIGK